MKTTKHEAAVEKEILTAMVVNDTVLGRVAGKWHADGLFRVRWANQVGKWCVDYQRRYGEAPKQHIEGLFESWAATATSEDTVDLVDRFLGSISEEYEEADDEINPEYVIDKAAEHFNSVLLERMAEVVKGHIAAGNTTKAMEAVAKWNKVELGVGAGIDILYDEEAVKAAFESKTEPLVTYPGALGEFFGDQLARDEFVSIIGSTGKGKTWWLMDIAWQAVRQKRRVAFFEVGDMSQNQLVRRFMARNACHPLKPPYDIKFPTGITRDEDANMAEVEYDMKRFNGPLQWEAAWEACKKRTRRRKKPLLRLSVHPNTSINVEGIRAALAVWERDGWVPDVIAIDYADILAPPTGYLPGERDGINETWKQLRGLNQETHTLLITAEQGDAPSYEATTIRRGNFSDDRRKNDHVTGKFGINSTEEEQEQGIQRLNWIKRREEAYVESSCVHVAGCLALGRPHVKSTF